ncbi:hypothetical protein GCM10027413_25000 [Conyzicola nivalis]|uniref:Asparagine synthase n=1 Tax=Conyzicola nivalis TaxID=1477021 RepID=A0A916WDE8_9MICO|nr:hypothetical protein [Conyzicola nivalis]GGA90607.1 hypothetical protein GCM10010979_01620 [Conyzicola nivalis]
MDLGTYTHPPVAPLAPIEQVVEEGVMISASAVRMALKNQLIVAALREHHAYDPEAIAGAAREQLASVAAESAATAERLDEVRTERGYVRADAGEGDENSALRDEEYRRRPTVHRMLAEALLEMADDPAAIDELVDAARTDAAQEIGREVVGGLRARDFAADPDYEASKQQRLLGLISVDLAKLAVPEQ